MIFNISCPICGALVEYATSSSAARARRDKVPCKYCRNHKLYKGKINEIVTLLNIPKSDREIEKELGISRQLVARYREEHGIQPFVRKLTHEIEDTKVCNSCEKELSIACFQVNRRNGQYEYRYGFCNSCRNKKTKELRYNNLDNYLQSRISSIKKRARIKDLPFDLDLIFLKTLYEKTEGTCFYTDEKLSWGLNNGLKPNCISIDRVIPDLGYVKGNVVLCQNRINAIKRDVTLEELEKWMPDWYNRLIESDFVTVVGMGVEF